MLRFFFLLIFILAPTVSFGNSGVKLVEAAKTQIGVTVRYDSRYQRISYPGGDVSADRGVCTDVVIRAYRKLGVDLQVLVHMDMVKSWSAYPRLWQDRSPDSNIDHRRVPNLATFFKRHGQSLPVGGGPETYLPGDLVTWKLPSGVPHIGIVSGERPLSGVPLVIHNIGSGTRMDNRLFDFEITGHYRFPVKI